MKRTIMAAVAAILMFASIAMAEVIKSTGEVLKIAGDQITIKENDGGKTVTLTVKDPAIIAKFTSRKIDTGDTVQVKYDNKTNAVIKLEKPGC
jgi:hypothetical protein